jgi:hypothetical protein
MISVLETQSQEKDSELRRRHETIQTLQSTVERVSVYLSLTHSHTHTLSDWIGLDWRISKRD